MIVGNKLHCRKHCKLSFGHCAQAHEENNPTNSTKPCTLKAICLRPTGNVQGGYKFLNLRTNKKIARHSWTLLPMPKEVIDQVNAVGKHKGQPSLLAFYDQHGDALLDARDHQEVDQQCPETTGVCPNQTDAVEPQTDDDTIENDNNDD